MDGTAILALATDTAPSAPPTASELCDEHAPTVYRFARMVAADDHEAEDVAHDALVKAIRNLDRYDPNRGELRAWLWRIVVHAARDRGRLAGRRDALFVRLVDSHRHTPTGDPELRALASLRDQELIAAVRRLPKRDRSLVALRFGAALPFDEVGQALGLSPAAAKVATHRALGRLRQMLAKES